MLLQRTLSLSGDVVLPRQRSPCTEQHIMTVVHIHSRNFTLMTSHFAHQLAAVLHITATCLAVPRSLAWQAVHKEGNNAGH